MIALLSLGAALTSLYRAALLQAAMIILNLERIPLPFLTLRFGHALLVGYPVFSAAVWGDCPKKANETKLTQMNDQPQFRRQERFHCYISGVIRVQSGFNPGSIRVHLPIRF